MPRGKELALGAVYGCLTVLREFQRDAHGLRRYWCRCSCGHEGARTVAAILRLPVRCKKHGQAVAA